MDIIADSALYRLGYKQIERADQVIEYNKENVYYIEKLYFRDDKAYIKTTDNRGGEIVTSIIDENLAMAIYAKIKELKAYKSRR